MCLAEVHEGAAPLSRRNILLAGAAGALAVGGSLLFPGVAGGAERGASGSGRRRGLRMTWFGTNGWKLEFRAGGTDRTMLVDPFFARFKTGFLENRFDPSTPLRPADPALIGNAKPSGGCVAS